MSTTTATFLKATFGSATVGVKTVLWPIFGVIFAAYVIVSLILLYHWRRYALHNKRVALAEATYFVISIAVVAIALFALIFV